MKKFALTVIFAALMCGIAIAHEGHKHAMGVVTAINGSDITVKTRDGQTPTIAVSSETQIIKGDDPAKLSDVHVGDKVMAHGPEKDGKIQAEELRIHAAQPAANAAKK
jgi:Domain of unknown function (DUF5666)